MSTNNVGGNFDFGAAITQIFKMATDKRFAKRLWLAASAAYAVVFAVCLPLMLRGYPAMLEANWKNMQAMKDGTPPLNEGLFEAFASMGLGYLVLIVGVLITGAAVETALHKKVLRDEDVHGFPLRFGGLELKVMLAQLSVWVLWFTVYVVTVIVLVLFSTVLGAITPILGAIVGGLGIIAILCLLVYVPIKLSMAAALTVRENKFQIMPSVKASKGIFWHLFGAYILVGFVGYIAIYLVITIFMFALAGDGTLVEALSGFGTENPRIAFGIIAERIKNPLIMLIGIIGIFVYSGAYAFYTLSISGISSYATKWRTGGSEADEFD